MVSLDGFLLSIIFLKAKSARHIFSDYLDLYKSGAFATERATVASFKGPSSVVLSTDTIVDADIIILATGGIDSIAREVEIGISSLTPPPLDVLWLSGYQLSLPFLDESMQRQIGIKPLEPDGDKVLRLYRGVLPAQDHKNMAFVGYIQGLFDLLVYQTQANWIAGLFSGQFELPGPKQRDSDVNQALSFMRRFNKYSDGTSVAGWQFQYMKKLLDDMSIPFDLTRAMSHDTLSEFRANVCKQLEDFTLIRLAIARARQPRLEHQMEPQMPHIPEKIRGKGSDHHLPKFLAELESTCQTKGDKVFARWYDEAGKEVKTATFLGVWKEAQVLAQCMRHEWGLSQGDRVMLIYFPGIHVLPVVLGCFLSGVVPTFIHPPNPNQLKEFVGFLMKVVQNFRPSFGLVDRFVMEAIKSAWLDGLSPEGFPRFILTDDSHIQKWSNKYKSLSFDVVNINKDDLAFIQYKAGKQRDVLVGHHCLDCTFIHSSHLKTGSGSYIHGVMVTHKALQSNIDLTCEGMYDCFVTRQGYMPENVRCFNWLPQ